MFVGLKCPPDRELQDIEVKLEPMKRRNKFERFLKATDDDADIRELRFLSVNEDNRSSAHPRFMGACP